MKDCIHVIQTKTNMLLPPTETDAAPRTQSNASVSTLASHTEQLKSESSSTLSPVNEDKRSAQETLKSPSQTSVIEQPTQVKQQQTQLKEPQPQEDEEKEHSQSLQTPQKQQQQPPKQQQQPHVVKANSPKPSQQKQIKNSSSEPTEEDVQHLMVDINNKLFHLKKSICTSVENWNHK